MKWQNQKRKHIKRMVNNCHIPDLVQAFSYVENGGLNLVVQLTKYLTFMTIASNSYILTTMYEQNKQTQQAKMFKIGVQQTTLCYNSNHYKNKQICTKQAQIDKTH